MGRIRLFGTVLALGSASVLGGIPLGGSAQAQFAPPPYGYGGGYPPAPGVLPGSGTQPADGYEPDEDFYYAPRARPKPSSQGLGAAPGVLPPAAMPQDADPAYSTGGGTDTDIDNTETTRVAVADPTGQPAGTLTINTATRKLYLSQGGGQALEYGIGVGRQGFAWKGEAHVGRKAYWPGWTPPKEMLLRRPDLPAHMDGGIDNPLGARALYLFQGGKDTLFRIHGTNEPDTIGKAVSSGCIRMLNTDVIDLYGRVAKGARVVVL